MSHCKPIRIWHCNCSAYVDFQIHSTIMVKWCLSAKHHEEFTDFPELQNMWVNETWENTWQSIRCYWLWRPRGGKRGEEVSQRSECTHIKREDCVFFGTLIWCEANKHLDYDFDFWRCEEAARTKQSPNRRGGAELVFAFCEFCICADGSGEGSARICVCVRVMFVFCPWVRKHTNHTAIQMGFLSSVPPEITHRPTVHHLTLNNNLKHILPCYFVRKCKALLQYFHPW